MSVRYPGAGTAWDVDTWAPGPVAGLQVVTGPGAWIIAVAFTNTDPANPAALTLYAGNSEAAQSIVDVTVPAASSWTWTPGPYGLPAPGGLALDITTGTIRPTITFAREAPA